MKESLNTQGIDHLFGRFSWLNNNEELDHFINSFGLSAWGEDRTLTDETIIYFVSTDRKFVLQLVPDQERKNAQTFFTKLPITPEEVKSIYTEKLWEKRTGIENKMMFLIPSRTADLKDFVWVVPQKDTNEKMVSRYYLSKEGEEIKNRELTSFVYTTPSRLPVGHNKELLMRAASDPAWPGDTLATNDLHHPNDEWLNEEAKNLVSGLTTNRDKAQKICDYFTEGGGSKMKYCEETSPDHDQFMAFTHSDRVINNFGRLGICDEFAVFQMSFLRAVGIRCRIVFLWWTSNSKYSNKIVKQKSSNPGAKEVGHAVIEYLDSNRWVHLDGLWGQHDNPGHYKQTSGSASVKARWQGFPDDNVSSWDTGGFRDPKGDEILNNLNDWQIITNTTNTSSYNP